MQLRFSRSRISAVSKTPCCGRHDSKIMMPSILVYGVSLIVAFPVMLGMNLDQACALHSWNTTNATNITTNISMTTTSHYNMVSPDPNRIMRTMCWRRDTHMDKPALVVPWSAVFSPLFISMALALVVIISRFCGFCAARWRLKIREDQYRSAEQNIKVHRQKLRARIEAKLLAETDAGDGVSNIVKTFVGEFMAATTVKPFPFRPRSIDVNMSCLERHFVDSFALIIGLVAVVIYGVADWGCYFGDMGMDAEAVSVVVFCILVVLCVAMDLVVGVQFVRFLLMAIDEFGGLASNCRTISIGLPFALFGVLILQQLFLLLEMFTFFHEVSFFVVFLPLLVAIIIWHAIVCCYGDGKHKNSLFTGVLYGIFTAIVCAPFLTSMVLLMFKADNFFEVGTAPIGLPKMSWAVVMMPIWLQMAIASCPAVTCFLCNHFFFSKCKGTIAPH